MSEHRSEPDDDAMEELLSGRATPPAALAPLLAALTSPGTADATRLNAALAAFEAAQPGIDGQPEVDELEPHRRRRWAARSLVAALVAVAAALGAGGVAIAASTGHLRLPAIVHRPAPHPSRSVLPSSTAPSTAPTATGSATGSPSRSAGATSTSGSASPTATSSSAAPSSSTTSVTPSATASLVPPSATTSVSLSASLSPGPTTSHVRPTTKPTPTHTPAATASRGKSAGAPGHTKTTAAGE